MSGKKASSSKAVKQPAAKPLKKPTAKSAGFFSRNAFPIALFLITFVVFGNAIFNGYALDDEFYTAGGNKLTKKGAKAIPEIFKSRTFYNSDGSGYSYRPVAVSSFALEHQLFGEDPTVSHFINVLLYALTMVLLFAVLRRWFATLGDWFSFFVALIFLVHPLHTEVVDNIKCRDELLAFLFTVLTILFIWKHRETGKWFYFALAPLCFFAAMLSKHTIIPFFVLIPMALWFFTEEKWTKIALYMAPLVAMAALVFIIQTKLIPPHFREYKAFENPLVEEGFGFFQRMALALYVLGRYLWLHFIPHPLAYYYGQNYVPLVGWGNWIVLLSLAIHLALGLLMLLGLRKKTILGFGLLFYLVNIAAYSNLLQPAPGLMAERFTYASSLGFAIVAVFLVFKFMKKDPLEFRWKAPEFKTVRTVFLVVTALYAVRSIARNETWEDKATLYGNDMEHLEESAKANMLYGALLSRDAMEARLYGKELIRNGREAEGQQKLAESNALFVQARGHYKKAAEVAPYYHTAWSNLGTTYYFVDQPREALPYFLKGVSLRPDYQEGNFNTGMAYDQMNLIVQRHKDDTAAAYRALMLSGPRKPVTEAAWDSLGKMYVDSSIYFLGRSIASDSTYVTAYEQLSRVMIQNRNDTATALRLLRLAARNKPDSESAWNSLGKFYIEIGDTASGAGAWEMAAEINPDNLQRLANLAQYYQMHGNAVKAARYGSLYREGMARQQELMRKQQRRK